ncbi:MAG: ferritin family protein [Methanosarcinaceae archaeon]|nr:ferritin family protein [Methanosarcinaceae archaeon]MDF1534533.1 ferritin family protein [Methanosarcinaceae archaeon]
MSDLLKDISGTIEGLKTFDDVLDVSITLEEQGREFYLEKASTIKSVETIGLYNYLAEEEGHHADYLRQYRKDKNVPKVRSNAPDFKTSFSMEFIDGRLGEIGVLLAALRLERKSEYFYTELSKRADNEEQRDFFNKLASFERGHYELIDGFLGESTQFRMQT